MTNDELLAELDRRRAELSNGGTAGAPAAPFPALPMAPAMPMQPPPMMAPPPMVAQGGGGARAMGLLVSISIPTPQGDVPCYLQLGPEAAANPQVAVQQLMQSGWPVKCWPPRQPGGWGQGGQGGGRGWGRRY